MAVIPPDICFNLVLNGLTKPAVFRGMTRSWSASGWDLKSLSSLLGDKVVQFRIGPNSWDTKVLWESDCCYEEATVQDFQEWLNQGKEGHANNPLLKYSSKNTWAYADYKYMAEMFADQPEVLKAVSWEVFGFPDRDGAQSTLWMGSCGAHTPCHYDTYGCNLVAQIKGRKRWFLFPPHSTLYPTRVPYEESSVFSLVNIKCPDLKKFRDFKNCQPYIVTLNPGEVLYVPKKWWHFVESLDTSLSVNTWIELPSDTEVRMEEAVVKILVSSVMLQTEEDSTSWLNPTEELSGHSVNMQYLNHVLVEVTKSRSAAARVPGLKRKFTKSSELDRRKQNVNQAVEGKKFKRGCDADETPPVCVSCGLGLPWTEAGDGQLCQCENELPLTGPGDTDKTSAERETLPSRNIKEIKESATILGSSCTCTHPGMGIDCGTHFQEHINGSIMEILEKYKDHVHLVQPTTFEEYLEIIKHGVFESSSENESVLSESETEAKKESETKDESITDKACFTMTSEVQCDKKMSVRTGMDIADREIRGQIASRVTTEDFVNAITHPDAIALICKHLIKSKST
ncbi:HSPB1-associated protein 1 homolog [Lingula anatina]|uniref:HSPB1-associated protein 1 homolog n=1 Tax=Lingula anatina TaxID=7574 RepID=A0A1S3JUW7_LINAN|nr:HSPB1-associated protein 1 homolog [Lingula anatina]|eukprot:XP_013413884.1 HSPB1-associated protein 1 homolog [Lingula anatina]